ncbi:uncharacterized protein PHACADRAFT_178792 [Phanerochaete carnosa HHB-10118-sp]|uniref:Uncharacterized protein n=1 Tax=Phanerochaete carnosa (strain HHB-10118-sp) TaxID=650164 RepID=K5VTQ0_PHACS|nr:uncharacterized protein PHACADRAFT_178792 [Phanerochaete carnosa HHB-10118-sp]EKM50175.1 hypothetical protein PHACADRAFT_178792 [Phanerochaete carnosa HHB-10118-sp]
MSLPTSRMLRLLTELLLSHIILGVVGEARLRELSISKPGPWAGHRILCYGDYCWGFPAGVEEDISAQITAHTGHGGDYAPYFSACVDYTYKRAGSHNLELRFRPLSSADRKRVHTFITANSDIGLRLDIYARDLMLCNLSKGEYVRNDACMELNKIDGDDKTETEVDLGLNLFSCSCRSTDNSCSMAQSISDRLVTGPWAGDRFEIVPKERMERNTEWKDITEEAIALLREIYESER